MIALNVITMGRDDELMRLLSVCRPYVDVMRVCDGGGSSETQNLVVNLGGKYFFREWDDDYSAQDNLLLEDAKEGEWQLWQDDDEMPSIPLLKQFLTITNTTEYDMIMIPSLDVIDGAMMCSVDEYVRKNAEGEAGNRFRKPWFFRYYDGVYMEGTPHRSPHKLSGEWVRHDVDWPYLHIKTSDSFIVNDCIHAFINPEQQQYSDDEAKQMYKYCKKAGIRSSRDILHFLKYGNIRDDFRDWIVNHSGTDKPISAWFIARYFLYRPDELVSFNFMDILTSGAMSRFVELKSCWIISNIRTMQIHPLLKQMILQYGMYHSDDIRALVDKSREPVREEIEVPSEAKGISDEEVQEVLDDFVETMVIDGSEDRDAIPIPQAWLNKEFREDQQDNPEYWNDPERVENDTGKEFDMEAEMAVGDEHAHFCEKYNVPVHPTILEFGCGGGRILAGWVGMALKYNESIILYGLDHAEKAIDLVIERLPQGFVKPIWGNINNFANDHVGEIDVIYTHTALQHNSKHKQDEIFAAMYQALQPYGILYLINEMTFSRHGWPEHVENQMSPWFADDRGSAGTASWWIARITDFGFELLEYGESRYVFRKIEGAK